MRGVGYERLGQFGGQLGRNCRFDVTKSNPNPPPSGSLAGYIVASNFPGTVPAGVVRADNTFGNYDANPNTIAPPFGFSCQILPDTNPLSLRGAYLLHYPRPTTQTFITSVTT